MSTHHQLAKIQPPSLHQPVPRIRLFERLDALRRYRVLWIGSPAGAGKSTLLASYASYRGISTAWMRIDKGDDDPAGFFFYLNMLAGRFHDSAHASLPLLTPEYLLDFDGYVRRYFRALFQSMPPDSMLVFDNCQEVDTPEFLRILEMAAQLVPDSITLVLISRQELPRHWAHLVAGGVISTLGWDDLKLNEGEAVAVARSMGVKSAAMVASVVEQVDGWAAGLVLLCASARSQASPGVAPAAGSREVIFEYFAGQVFDALDEAERVFLTHVAAFEQFSVVMAQAQTCIVDADGILEHLHRQHYFTDKWHTTEAEYRFHPLFRAFLLSRLAQLSKAEQIRVHARAARIAADMGRKHEAARLFQASEDWNELTGVILTEAESMLAQGRWQTLLRWIFALPESVRDEHAWVNYWLGMAHLRLDQQRAIEIFERTYARFERQRDTTGQTFCSCAAIFAFYFQLGRFGDMDIWLERLERLMRAGESRYPSDKAELQVSTALLTAAMMRRPDMRVFDAADRVITLLASPHIGTEDKVLVGSIVLQFCVVAGDLIRAQRLLELLAPCVESPQAPALSVSFLLSAAGYLYYCNGDNGRAREHLQRATELAQHESLYPALAMADHFSVHLFLSEGRLEEAKISLERMGRLLPVDRPALEAMHKVDVCAIAYVAGDLIAARRAGMECIRQSDATGVRFFQIAYRALVATVLIAAGDHQEAQRLVTEGTALSRGTIYESFEALLRYVDCLRQLGMGDRAQARNTMDLALRSAAESERFSLVRCTLDLAPEGISFAIAEGVQPGFARHVARKLRLVPGPNPPVDWPWPVKIRTLGQFSICLDDVPLAFGRKAPKKDLAFIKLLVAGGETGLGESRIKDELWPDSEGDLSANALRQLIHRVRGLLDLGEAVGVTDGTIFLRRERVWVDAWELEALCRLCSMPTQDPSVTHRHGARILELYQGGFLREETDMPLLTAANARLRNRFVDAMLTCGRRLHVKGDLESSWAFVQGALQVEPASGALCELLVEISAASGRRAEGLAALQRLQDEARGAGTALAAGLVQSLSQKLLPGRQS